MATEAELKKRMKRLRSGVGKMPNVTISFKSARGALMQGLLSRAGREVGTLLPELARGQRYPQVCRNSGVESKEIFV